MSEEALMIMRMVHEGKITPEQGVSPFGRLEIGIRRGVYATACKRIYEQRLRFEQQPGELVGWQRLWWLGSGVGSAAKACRNAAAPRGTASQARRYGQRRGNVPAASNCHSGWASSNIWQILDETLRGVTALKSEAVIGAKKAARQAQKEARRFRHEAERMGKNIHVEVHVRTDGERPSNTSNLPERSERGEKSYDMPDSGVVSLVNLYGDIRVAGTSADGKIRISTEKTVWANASASGEELLQAIDVLPENRFRRRAFPYGRHRSGSRSDDIC